jgi:hypothetical protein
LRFTPARFSIALGKIDERRNLVTAPDEFIHRIRADKSGAACNEVAHFWGILLDRFVGAAAPLGCRRTFASGSFIAGTL